MDPEVWIVLTLQICDGFEDHSGELLLHVTKFHGIIIFRPQLQIVITQRIIRLRASLRVLRLAINDELEGLADVVAFIALMLHREHHAVLKETTVEVGREVSGPQCAEIEGSVRVHAPGSPLLYIFAEHKLLLKTHWSIPAGLRVAAALAATLDLFMEAALEVILSLFTALWSEVLFV